MRLGLDTSVVLRLLTGVPAAHAEVARRFVAASATPATVSDLVVGESYFALLHHYNATHAEAVHAIRDMLSDPHIDAPGVARSVVHHLVSAQATRNSPGLMDHLIHGSYFADAVTLVTFDRALSTMDGAILLEG